MITDSKEILIVEWQLDDILGELKRISLVSEPAIESDFMLFSDVELKFKSIDDEKRILTGPAMRPNINIKRYNDKGELYYGFFSEEVVRQAAEMFFKKGSNINKTNLEHEFEIDGVYVFESWIVENPEVDKSRELGFSGVKKGDWFVSMKVDNDVVWNNYLKTGIIRGFSVEIRADEKEIDTIEMIKSVLQLNKSVDWKYEAITVLLAGEKISFDFHDTINTPDGKKLAKKKVEEGYDVYIISAGQNKDEMLPIADEVGIPHNKVFALGSNTAKIQKIQDLGITKHYDNNADVISQIGSVGIKFIDIIAKPYVDETAKIKKEPVMGLEVGVPHYTADGKLWTGPTHKDASGRLMTGATHTEDSEYLYHEDELMKFESYDDYPEAATRNAQIALDWAEKNGWGSCGTPVGKARANQLAKGEKISEDTIARMAGFERHRQNSQKELGDGCGRLMWQSWGGDEGIAWASKKLEQIRKSK